MGILRAKCLAYLTIGFAGGYGKGEVAAFMVCATHTPRTRKLVHSIQKMSRGNGYRSFQLYMAAAAGKGTDDGANETLGVSEEHQCFVKVVERVVDSGEAGGHAAF